MFFLSNLPKRRVVVSSFRMKTITLSDEAYARIEAAKHAPNETDSDVLLRALPAKGTQPVEDNRWRRFACSRADEREELRRIATVIDDEFERIEPEDAE